ncbi:hypothetical protein ABZS93_00705 [Streptomyces sp900116325]|uniref:hypothetical protein n=1 Tax=Streptomyces sp. 900116325 TaxID=3154295 RepID=UPI0033BA611B
MTSSREEPTEVVLVRQRASAAPGAVAVVRLLAGLPPHWACACAVGCDRITLRVGTPAPGGTEAVTTVVAGSAPPGWAVPR